MTAKKKQQKRRKKKKRLEGGHMRMTKIIIRIKLFKDVMASALQRGISYREALKNKMQYADLMAELTEEEEKQEENSDCIDIPSHVRKAGNCSVT